jgi:dienelactone hydrolase
MPAGAETVAIPGVLHAEVWRPAEEIKAGVLLVEGSFERGGWEQDTAEELTASGHLVLRVLPDRARPDGGDPHAHLTAPADERTLAGLRSAIAWLRGRDEARRVLLVGARMGGRDAMALAGEPGVVGVVSWYGMPPAELTGPHAPILAFFGGKDRAPAVEDARRLEAMARGRDVRVTIYPEAQHGFAQSGPAFDKKATISSWTLAYVFLDDRSR